MEKEEGTVQRPTVREGSRAQQQAALRNSSGVHNVTERPATTNEPECNVGKLAYSVTKRERIAVTARSLELEVLSTKKFCSKVVGSIRNQYRTVKLKQ